MPFLVHEDICWPMKTGNMRLFAPKLLNLVATLAGRAKSQLWRWGNSPRWLFLESWLFSKQGNCGNIIHFTSFFLFFFKFMLTVRLMFGFLSIIICRRPEGWLAPWGTSVDDKAQKTNFNSIRARNFIFFHIFNFFNKPKMQKIHVSICILCVKIWGHFICFTYTCIETERAALLSVAIFPRFKEEKNLL